MKVHFESIDEFVEWSWKEKQHKEELQQHNTELEIENRRLKKELIKRMKLWQQSMHSLMLMWKKRELISKGWD